MSDVLCSATLLLIGIGRRGMDAGSCCCATEVEEAICDGCASSGGCPMSWRGDQGHVSTACLVAMPLTPTSDSSQNLRRLQGAAGAARGARCSSATVDAEGRAAATTVELRHVAGTRVIYASLDDEQLMEAEHVVVLKRLDDLGLGTMYDGIDDYWSSRSNAREVRARVHVYVAMAGRHLPRSISPDPTHPSVPGGTMTHEHHPDVRHQPRARPHVAHHGRRRPRAGACGGDDPAPLSEPAATVSTVASEPVAPPTTTPPPATAPAAADAAVKISQTALGDVLSDPDGMTLYTFTNDVNTTSTCSGTCAEAWPPVLVDPDFIVSPGLDSGIFATTPHEDGTHQLVAGKWPLYLYAADAKPGDVTGQGSGDVWFAVDTGGRLIDGPAAQGSDGAYGTTAPTVRTHDCSAGRLGCTGAAAGRHRARSDPDRPGGHDALPVHPRRGRHADVHRWVRPGMAAAARQRRGRAARGRRASTPPPCPPSSTPTAVSS